MHDTYSVKFDSNIPIKLRDGTITYADVCRPNTTGRFPALLHRTPYNKSGPTTHSYSLDCIRAAETGYAVVMQDVRGRYSSEGQFTTFHNELNDGHDSVEWAAAQPWCNGKVGMYGDSYVGATQWLAASRKPPSLMAMAPGVTASNYHDGWTYQGGAYELAFNLNWALNALTTDNYDHLKRTFKLPTDGIEKLRDSVDNIAASYEYLPLTEWPDLKGELAPYYYEWLAHPEYDDYWKKVCIEEYHPQITVPALNYGGWYDIFLGGTIRNFTRMQQLGATETSRNGQRLLIGPWVHTGVGNTFPGTTVGSHYFGMRSYSSSIDLPGIKLRYFDHFLKDMDNGVAEEKPVRIFVMGDNLWRHEDSWPLRRAVPSIYYLHSRGQANTLNGNGTLSLDIPNDEPSDVFLYNPDNPVPSHGGGLCCYDNFANAGAFNQQDIETRHDVLVYSSPQLEKDVEVTGPVIVKLFASTSAKDTDFTAKLVDVCSDDTCARNLTDGIIRARYRGPSRQSHLVDTGSIYEYTIDLWATSNVFKKGHRIRVEISSSNFPRFNRNTNTGNNIAEDVSFVTAKQTILHNQQYPSHIVLPIVPR